MPEETQGELVLVTASLACHLIRLRKACKQLLCLTRASHNGWLGTGEHRPQPELGITNIDPLERPNSVSQEPRSTCSPTFKLVIEGKKWNLTHENGWGRFIFR